MSDIDRYTYYTHIRQLEHKQEILLDGDRNNFAKKTEEVIDLVRKFPLRAEARFKALGIYNRRDPIAEMDEWSQKFRKDIKWVEEDAKTVLQSRKDQYKGMSREEIYRRIGNFTKDDKAYLEKNKFEFKNVDKLVQDMI